MSTPVTPPAPKHARLDSFEAVFQVAQLTAKRSVKGWRAIVSLAVVALPAALAGLVRAGGADQAAQERFFYGMLSQWHFGIAVPVVALVFATAFPWPEADEGTLTYWFTSPIPRWTVLLGRYLAAMFVGAVILAVGVLAIGLPLDTKPEADIGHVMQVSLASTVMAYPAYLALFQLVSTVFRQGLVFGVIFIAIENFISILSGTAVVQLTIMFYVRSQVWPAVPKTSRWTAEQLLHVAEPATNLTAIAVFSGVTLVALGLSLWMVGRIEYRGRSSQQG
jgi:ABC-type transport system involved in multi-copper enzyme maturation permease subunit